MIKTKFFESLLQGKIEEEVNKFLEEKKIVDVKVVYNTSITGPHDALHTVMIVYRIEGGDNDEMGLPSSPSIGTLYVDNEGAHKWNGKEWIHD